MQTAKHDSPAGKQPTPESKFEATERFVLGLAENAHRVSQQSSRALRKIILRQPSLYRSAHADVAAQETQAPSHVPAALTSQHTARLAEMLTPLGVSIVVPTFQAGHLRLQAGFPDLINDTQKLIAAAVIQPDESLASVPANHRRSEARPRSPHSPPPPSGASGLPPPLGLSPWSGGLVPSVVSEKQVVRRSTGTSLVVAAGA